MKGKIFTVTLIVFTVDCPTLRSLILLWLLFGCYWLLPKKHQSFTSWSSILFVLKCQYYAFLNITFHAVCHEAVCEHKLSGKLWSRQCTINKVIVYPIKRVLSQSPKRFSIPVLAPHRSAYFVCYSYRFRCLFYSNASALRSGHHRIFRHDSSSKRTYIFHSKCI